jgi:hypothetical protein
MKYRYLKTYLQLSHPSKHIIKFFLANAVAPSQYRQAHKGYIEIYTQNGPSKMKTFQTYPSTFVTSTYSNLVKNISLCSPYQEWRCNQKNKTVKYFGGANLCAMIFMDTSMFLFKLYVFVVFWRQCSLNCLQVRGRLLGS